jgi:predicted amidophosphoribosyltransferase
MNRIKFSCPRCGKHIEAEADATKTGIQCPSCQTGFVPTLKKSLPIWLLPAIVIILGTSVIIWLQMGELLLWPIIGGIIGAGIGQEKKQWASGLLWGALLGPIGWIIVYFLPHRGPKCPECLAPVDPAARKCRHCGSEMSAALGK